MPTLLWHLSAAVRGYLRFYMPTNIAVDWLRSARGFMWAIPVALVATPAYLGLTAICIHYAERPGFGWLNLLVFLYYWNAVKFAWLTILTLLHSARRSSASTRLARPRGVGRPDLRA